MRRRITAADGLKPIRSVIPPWGLSFLLAYASVASLSCGKVGAPLPPLQRAPLRVETLTALQRGDRIILFFLPPDLKALDARGFRLARIDVYRLIERRGRAGVPEEESFSERASLIGFISVQEIALAPTETPIIFTDGPLVDFEGSYVYAVRFVSDRGQNSPFSNLARVEPNGKVTIPPKNVRARDEAQDTILVTWDVPERNIDGSEPETILGYNIYRKQVTDPTFSQPLNGPVPVTEARFVDRDFSYGVEYHYMVRSVSASTSGEQVESLDSSVIRFTPHDTFPPSPPEGLTAASANGVITLFWMANAEQDLAGYNIYRSESEGAPSSDWKKLNPRAHTLTTFVDEQVQQGKRYFYRLTAVDRFGNESQPTPPISQEVL